MLRTTTPIGLTSTIGINSSLDTNNMDITQSSSGSSVTEQVVVFNAKSTKMLICDLINWRSPDASALVVAFIVPCPSCGYPIITKPDQISFTYSEDRKVSLNQKINCPSRWRKVDESGVVDVDEEGSPLIIRCGWSCNGISNNVLREETKQQ